MKSIKLLLFFSLLVTLVYSIFEFKSPDHEIFIPLSRKQFMKLESGNVLNNIYGISSTFNGIKCRVKINGNNLLISSKNILYKGFRSLILIPDFQDYSINIHNRLIHRFESKNILFSNYDYGKYLILPIFNQENIEIFKERFEKIDFNTNDTLVFKKSKNNLIFSNSRGDYYRFEKSIFLKDAVSEKYSELPDFFSPLTKDYVIPEDFDDHDIVKSKILLKEKYSEKTYISNGEINNSENNLTLKKNSSLIFTNCVINFKDLKIISTGINSIIFYDSDVNFEGVTISNLSEFRSENFNLPSGLTFINSNIKINNSIFLNNLSGDDFINFYHSIFKVENSVFKGVHSDAIDSDFSSGEISNSNFFSIGNDAIDTSGSILKVSNCFFKNVSDKSLSIGEESTVNSSNNNFINNSIGLVLKDGSTLISKEDFFKGNDLDLSIYQKKDFYKKSKMFIDKEIKNLNYLIEKNSFIISLDTIKIKKIKNVEDLMYGKKFGRKTLK